MTKVSRARRRQIIDALGRGTVPSVGLDLFAVGMDRFERALDDDLTAVTAGGAGFKAIRGEYGSGKTFFARWLAEKAKRKKMAASEIQISERTPLHRLDTVYRSMVGSLSTASIRPSALRDIVDTWLLTLEDDTGVARGDRRKLSAAVEELIETRLAATARNAPAFSAALRFYRRALMTGDQATADGLLAWVSGEPNVSATVRRYAGLKGDVDGATALHFLQGLLTVLRDCGHPGLLVVLDEVETLQKVRSDYRDRGLNALRQLIDEIDKGRFPGLYLVVTGTPAFYDGQLGVQRLTPLAQRLHTDFTTDPRFDTARAVQIRLTGFDRERLVTLGCVVRDLYAGGDPAERRIRDRVDDVYIKDLAGAVEGHLGAGVAPRIFLRKLVQDVLHRVSEHEHFDPRRDYRQVSVVASELTDDERNAYEKRRRAVSADDVDLDLP
ncbi:BREX system ATP-binding protein BrxD [Herbidospora galbida]|uniref:BREX system ATP-binding protein BrxD n=1 Tax=Herbidospora galbida TaxID=2575442 RepID=A0A4U3MEI5_9ACTN|nr:BREX system ATP-binding protein BrxD [Herbidospora galbida]TKK87521.1 BREX system ATP-binding protein BrxD [Herbidospora galbida]